MARRVPGPWYGVLLFLLATAPGCRDGMPLSPPGETTFRFGGTFPEWPLPAGEPLRPPPGTQPWTWRARDDSSRSGPASLRVTGTGWTWELAAPPAGLPRRLRLEPRDSTAWHGVNVTLDTLRASAWFPLARRPVLSPHHADLLDLLLSLVRATGTTLVVHWPTYPVTVGAGEAVSGSVDLAACLADGVAWWSGHLPGLFAWRPDPACAVRLLHIPGHQLHPPVLIRVLQRDDRGRPLRMQIRVGDTYDSPRDERYARRALLHELTHAAGLWGHSSDRRHILWRAGPIVDVPDTDETLAVRWWLSLPEGLDLARYGRRGELDPGP